MDENPDTSIPGNGNDPLEKDFEEQLAKEGLELEGRPGAKKEDPKPEPKVDPAKPEDKKPDADPDPKKPEEDKDKKDPAKKEEPEPWRQAIARKRQEQGKAKAEEPAKDPAPKTDPDPSKADPAKADPVVLTEEQKTLADKYGIEHEDYLKMFPTRTVEKEVVKNGLSPEQESLLNGYKEERDSLLIEKGFNADFDTNVLPLLKEEYPKGLTEDKIAEVKKSILSKIQDEKYSLVPLDELFRGDKAFRGLVKAPVSGPDSGSKIPDKANPSKVYDFDTVTEEDVKAPGFPFDEYSAYMEKKEKNKGK